MSAGNISVFLDTDYKRIINDISYKTMIYTQESDSYFKYKHGVLGYRSARYTLEVHDDNRYYQPYYCVENCTEIYSSIIEPKQLYDKFMLNNITYTMIVKQYIENYNPKLEKSIQYVPIKSEKKLEVASQYQDLKNKEQHSNNVLFFGRTHDYTFKSNDQLVKEAIDFAKSLV
jgi:UDP-galactopyranose mutase